MVKEKEFKNIEKHKDEFFTPVTMSSFFEPISSIVDSNEQFEEIKCNNEDPVWSY